MSLQIEDDEAEELKLKYGSAVQESDTDAHKPIALRDGRTIPYDEFMGLVEARVEEIVLNVKNQISLSNYDVSQLIGGLIVTGGAANIRNIDKAFTRRTASASNFATFTPFTLRCCPRWGGTSIAKYRWNTCRR